MTDNIQQATVCGIAFCPNQRNYWLIGQPNPKQIDPVLGSLWLATDTEDYRGLLDGEKYIQIYKHPYNVWLPIGTVIEFSNHPDICIEDK